MWVLLDMDVLTTITFGRSDALKLISVVFYVLLRCALLFRSSQRYIFYQSTAALPKK